MIRPISAYRVRISQCLLAVATLAVAAVPIPAKKLPLSPKILAAKTAFIDNQSGYAKIGDRAYDELRKWGRFQIVQDRKKADLVILLSAGEYIGGYVTSGGTQTGTVDESGNVQLSNSPTYTTPVRKGHTFLTVIDPATGESLWSDSKAWGNLYTGFHSATKGLVKELRKRIEEQEADARGKGK